MNIGIIVNSRCKVCLVHDGSFDATPLWVGYHVDTRKLEIIYDTSATYEIDWEATDEMNIYLMKINKILIMRVEDGNPIEGFETSFLRLKDGKVMNE
ncbi:MAG: hypothetical protein FWE93_00210 [Alphaproteobacteria bacterium]|nr:hypothetical protein [Alphaproteobacteria bacterium]